jgi:membrane-associated phospholipid phosphatase
METKGALPDIILHGLAAGTAFARVHVNKHWASDTVVGAGIGILTARFVRRHDRSAGVGTAMFGGSLTF